MSEQFVRWKYPGNQNTTSNERWWRRLSFGLIGLLCLVLVYELMPRRTPDTPQQHPIEQQFSTPSTSFETIDGLTSEQCRTTFPDLFADIDRAVAYWKTKDHKISSEDIDISHSGSAIRLLIHANEIRVLDSRNAIDAVYAAAGRAYGVLSLLQQALDTAIAIGETLPSIEVSLNFQDDVQPSPGETSSAWSFSRSLRNETYDRLWLMPNSDFWFSFTTGSFDDARRDAAAHDLPFRSKIPQLVWRGSVEMNPQLRGSLVETTRGKEWADVAGLSANSSMKVDEFCKYAATVHTEGVSFSGRLAFLTNCNSLLFIHELDWATHFSHLLIPNKNYIPVKRDWSDLEEKVEYYLRRPEEAEKVIEDMIGVLRERYTTRAATSCYLRELVRGWSQVAFVPETEGRRGVSFAQIMQTRRDGNFEMGVEYEKGRPAEHDEI